MAFLLFLDESGRDLSESPYEVLAGVAVEDSRIWNLITAIQGAESLYFGHRITEGELEIKAKKLLKRKTFRLGEQLPPLPDDERRELTAACLAEGRASKTAARENRATRRQITALAQAKVAFVGRVLELCAQHQVRVFASIVDRDAPRTSGNFLRKDYSYLFERFFYFLDEQRPDDQGLVIFDELERSESHLLIDQMSRYFQGTATGRLRASRIVPEPFFVHSDLTSLIQVADLVAYIVVWGVRIAPHMTRPARGELKRLADAVCALRHKAIRERRGEPFYVWSFAVLDDLRPLAEREQDEEEGKERS